MENPNRTEKSKKRTIIIPSGTLNEDETTIIHVPRKLNNAAPLLVTNYRDDTYLKVQSLPIWNDELSQEGCCFPDMHWSVQGVGCTDKEAHFTTLESNEDSDQGCRQTAYDYLDDGQIVCRICPPGQGACPHTCMNISRPETEPDEVEQYDDSSCPSPSGPAAEPSCCFDTTNPNITYDFRPAYECDYPEPTINPGPRNNPYQ